MKLISGFFVIRVDSEYEKLRVREAFSFIIRSSTRATTESTMILRHDSHSRLVSSARSVYLSQSILGRKGHPYIDIAINR